MSNDHRKERCWLRLPGLVVVLLLLAIPQFGWGATPFVLDQQGGGGDLNLDRDCVNGVDAAVTPFKHSLVITGCGITTHGTGVHTTKVVWEKKGEASEFKATILFILDGQQFEAAIRATCSQDLLLYNSVSCSNWQFTGTLEPLVNGNLTYLKAQFQNLLPADWKAALAAQDKPWPKVPPLLNVPSAGLPPDFHYQNNPPNNVPVCFSLPMAGKNAGKPEDWSIKFIYQKWSPATNSYGSYQSIDQHGFFEGIGGKYNILTTLSLDPGKYLLKRASYYYQDDANNSWSSEMHDFDVAFTVGDASGASPQPGAHIGSQELIEKIYQSLKSQAALLGSGNTRLLGASAVVTLEIGNLGENKPDLQFEHFTNGHWTPSYEPVAQRKLPVAKKTGATPDSWEYSFRSGGKWRARIKGQHGGWHEFDVPELNKPQALLTKATRTESKGPVTGLVTAKAQGSETLLPPPPRIIYPKVGEVFDEPFALSVKVVSDGTHQVGYSLGSSCTKCTDNESACLGTWNQRSNRFNNLQSGHYCLRVQYLGLSKDEYSSVSFEVKAKEAGQSGVIKKKTSAAASQSAAPAKTQVIKKPMK